MKRPKFSDSSGDNNGWFKCMRGPESIELIKASHCAFALAAVIAYRARYYEGFNEHRLSLGEALLGDYLNYGMTRQEYRTAKLNLEEWGFATFRTTNKGTIGKLINTVLFSTAKNESTTKSTNAQPTSNHQTTTNKEGKEIKNEKKGEDSPRVSWKEVKDLDRVERMIVSERAKQCPNRKLLENLVGERKKLIKAMEASGPSAVLESAPLAVVPKEIPFKDMPREDVLKWTAEMRNGL